MSTYVLEHFPTHKGGSYRHRLHTVHLIGEPGARDLSRSTSLTPCNEPVPIGQKDGEVSCKHRATVVPAAVVQLRAGAGCKMRPAVRPENGADHRAAVWAKREKLRHARCHEADDEERCGKGECELAPRLVEAEQRTQDRGEGGEEQAEEAARGNLIGWRKALAEAFLLRLQASWQLSPFISRMVCHLLLEAQDAAGLHRACTVLRKPPGSPSSRPPVALPRPLDGG
jgi:hypothetical protein